MIESALLGTLVEVDIEIMIDATTNSYIVVIHYHNE